MWKYLEEAERKTLLFTGGLIRIGVFWTNAYNAEWDCVMIRELLCNHYEWGEGGLYVYSVGVGWCCGLVGSCRL